MSARVGVVVATRNRRERVLDSLERLLALAERPPIVLVDNASTDDTPLAVMARHPQIDVVALDANLGAAARTIGVRRLRTPYVAFADDDSWWAPGALARAVEALERAPRLGLLAARVLVGPDERLDPVSAAMADSPLRGAADLPGPPVLGFTACGAVVRRAAYLEVGGFDPRYGVGGEEHRLALDLATAGWEVAYAPAVVAHHHPGTSDARPGRHATALRNDLWSAWLRRPAPRALARSVELVAGAGPRLATLRGVAQAVRGAPWVLRDRRVVPEPVERRVRRVEAAARRPGIAE